MILPFHCYSAAGLAILGIVTLGAKPSHDLLGLLAYHDDATIQGLICLSCMAYIIYLYIPWYNQGRQKFVEEYLIDPEQFWASIDISGGPESCWPWLKAQDPDGYGRFHIPGTKAETALAHRVAFFEHYAVCQRTIAKIVHGISYATK